MQGFGRVALAMLWAAWVACVPAPGPTLVAANERPFDFSRDTFAFANELQWRYRVDPATGEVTPDGPNPDAKYHTRCFVLSRSARQFYQFARFDAQQPRTGEADYRRRVREVIAHDPSETDAAERIAIPGYENLREFSRYWEPLLKEELGGWSDSEFQRGNWRMLWPFSSSDQERRAEAFAKEIAVYRPPIVHVADFPTLAINHALLLYGVRETAAEIRFDVYDPNDAAQPLQLVFGRGDGRFRLAPTRYFTGGIVDVYEVYRSALY
jgi:hypothetical protein